MSRTQYDSVMSSEAFLRDLSDLNNTIADSLIAAGEPVAINGNVCYLNMQENFHRAEITDRMERKRRALHETVQGISCFAELGVAGGHAALLALHSNPDLGYIGIDIGQRLSPSWPPVDVFVPAVFEWLQARFPDRVKLYMMDAIEGLERAAAEQPFGPIGLLHLDAAKKTRIAELQAVWPGLADHCYLLQGDARNGNVRASSQTLIDEGSARRPSASRFQDIRGPNYDLLETGRDFAEDRLSLTKLQNERVLLCVAHPDTETLFAGSTLLDLKDKADVMVACFFDQGPKRLDPKAHKLAMRRVCRSVGADHLQFPFAIQPDEPRLDTFIQWPQNNHCPAEMLHPPQEHPAFDMFANAALNVMRSFKPTTILTHNHKGENEHIEHVFLHYAVAAAAGRYGAARLLCFGQGLSRADLVIPARPKLKRGLFSRYLPQWDGVTEHDFALDDERFVELSDEETAPQMVVTG